MKYKGMLALAAAVLLAPAAVIAQNKTQTPPPAKESGCMAVMGDWKAQDARVDRLVADMNQANGAQKTEAVAAVVNEMAAQRKAMHRQMSGMMDHMKDGAGCDMMGGMDHMSGMMDHGSMPTAGGGSDSAHQH